MRRFNEWMAARNRGIAAGGQGARHEPSIVCVECERRVPLWDEMEQFFSSMTAGDNVRALQKQAATALDNQSKEFVLVGEVTATVAGAGQIPRDLSTGDHGIDMEIQFRLDPVEEGKPSEATGQRLYLQLKSGDSYLRRRKRDGAEIFDLPKERHARFWMDHPCQVMLVIRTSDGRIRWMEIRDHLKKVTNNGIKRVRQIVFDGEPFDVASVRRWRDRVLGQA
jgi:hypothetical protein